MIDKVVFVNMVLFEIGYVMSFLVDVNLDFVDVVE